jgi:Tol biopolymer transport system component/DNA-binding winged helix-turn-helix (wHTH) protein
MANLRHKTIYEFEKFRLDAGNLMLYQDEREISLAPKVIETLLALVERRGEILGKDELMELVWADSIVEESNLSQNLYLLRKTLGEGKNGKPLIETFRRRGYRFNGEVEIIEQKNAAKKSENVLAFAPHVVSGSGPPVKETRHGQVVALAEWQPHETDDQTTPALLDENSAYKNVPIISARPWLSNRKLIAACAVLAALAIAATVWKIADQNRYQASSDILGSLRIRPLINWDADAGEGDSGVRFSPNGTMIAYSRTKDGQKDIWTKQIPDGNPNSLTDGKWSNSNPIWSHDNQRIAFVSNKDNQNAIWTTPFSGGPLTRIKAIESGTNLLRWSKDGATIYYQQGFNLFALDIESKQVNQLTNFDSTNQAQFFSISPDEDRIAYASGANEQLHIFVKALDGGEPVQVTNNEGASDEYPFWLPDGERLIYSSKRDGVFQIYFVDLNEHKSVRLNIDISDRIINDVASTGDKILFSYSTEEGDLWKVDLDEKNETQISSQPGLELWTDASPDGKSIVLQTVTEEKHVLHGSIDKYLNDDKQPVNIASGGFSPTFSPDGRKIAFLRHTGNLFNIWMIEGDTEKQLTTGGIEFSGFSVMPYNRMQVKDYSWSPDGNSLIYCAKKDDLWNVWQVAADGSSQPEQISNNEERNLKFSGPLVSPGGEQIAFVSSPQKQQIDAKPINRVRVLNKQGSEKIIFSDESIIRSIGWTKPEGNLIVAMPEGKPVNPTKVKLVQISAGDIITNLASIDAAYCYSIRLSPDGQQIAYVAREEGKDNIRIISISTGAIMQATSNVEQRVYVSGITWSPDGKAIYYSTQKKAISISMIENFK